MKLTTNTYRRLLWITASASLLGIVGCSNLPKTASPVCVRKHMIRMLTRLQRRLVAHLPCRAVAELALTVRIAHLPLHPLVPHPVARHLAALHPVVTVLGNE